MSKELSIDTAVLPPAITGRAELSRLMFEIEDIDNEMEAQKVRGRGKKAAAHGQLHLTAGVYEHSRARRS